MAEYKHFQSQEYGEDSQLYTYTDSFLSLYTMQVLRSHKSDTSHLNVRTLSEVTLC